MLAQILDLSRQRLATLTKVTELRSTIVRAFHENLGRRELYSTLRGMGLGIDRAKFYRYSGNLYQHLAKATRVQQLGTAESFAIRDLPQENRHLPGRFWARVEMTLTTPAGTTESRFRTFSFDDKMTLADLQEDVADSFNEYFAPSQRGVSSVNVLEIYKQY